MPAITIGLDLAKNIFQAHDVNQDGEVVLRKRLRRQELLSFFGSLPPCLIGIEACSGSHHWARELIKIGHEVRMTGPVRQTICPAWKKRCPRRTGNL